MYDSKYNNFFLLIVYSQKEQLFLLSYLSHRFHLKRAIHFQGNLNREREKKKHICECLNYCTHQIIQIECKLKLINKLNHMTVYFKLANMLHIKCSDIRRHDGFFLVFVEN